MKAILAGIIVLMAGLFFKDGLLDRLFPLKKTEAIDFKKLSLTPKPNQYLVTPKGFGEETPHRESPEFPMSVEELERKWDEVAMKAPRIERLGKGEYAARSGFFRFPDLISVRFIPIEETSSTLAVYSRALYGHSDLGKNKERIDAWMSALSR